VEPAPDARQTADARLPNQRADQGEDPEPPEPSGHGELPGPRSETPRSEEPHSPAGQGAAAASIPEQAPPRSGGLSDRERAILEFEKRRWRHVGAKEQAIRDRFDVSATRYYQVLNALIDRPEALAAEPVLVGRLLRRRAALARSRSADDPRDPD
jgi:Protein of unknown function (DUF3263)